MKFKFSVFVLFLCLLAFACEFPKDDVKQQTEEIIQYKNVGHQIPLSVGLRWMEYYKEKNKASGRMGIPSLSVPARRLNEILNSVSDLVGLAYHYGLSPDGVTHIMAVPISGKLTVWGDANEKLIVDTNSGALIDATTAKAWADAYTQANPDGIWFHFFGKNVFNEITSISFLNELVLQPAINDENDKPQLLMIIWNTSNQNQNGKSANDNGLVFDASNPCPPCGINYN